MIFLYLSITPFTRFQTCEQWWSKTDTYLIKVINLVNFYPSLLCPHTG